MTLNKLFQVLSMAFLFLNVNRLSGQEAIINSKDDVAGLFQSMGMDEREFRDFSRDRLSFDVQKKWTILDAIPINKQVVKPVSQNLQMRSDSKNNTGSNDALQGCMPPFSLGPKKFGSSAREQSGQITAAAPTFAVTETRAAVQRPPMQAAAITSLFSQEQVQRKKPPVIAKTSVNQVVGAELKAAGMFSNVNSAPLLQPTPVASKTNGVSNDESLASVFLRLERPPLNKKEALMGSQCLARLGRK